MLSRQDIETKFAGCQTGSHQCKSEVIHQFALVRIFWHGAAQEMNIVTEIYLMDYMPTFAQTEHCPPTRNTSLTSATTSFSVSA
jgi:hypothetical protein